MFRALAFSLSLATFLLASAECSAAKRVALVIGNDAYWNLPKLQKAVNDAHAVAGVLREIGFEVLHDEDVTRRAMNRHLADFEAAISPGDQAFFFFAGHGVAIGAENYLIPVDMPKPGAGEEGLVQDEGHAVSRLIERMQARGAKASFLVLDACRDNPFKAEGVRSIGGERGLTRINAPTGVFVLYSAGIGQTALDRLGNKDTDPNSVFTRKLVPLLRKPGLSHVRLAKDVQFQVAELTRQVPHRQQPAYYDQIIGEIILKPDPLAKGNYQPRDKETKIPGQEDVVEPLEQESSRLPFDGTWRVSRSSPHCRNKSGSFFIVITNGKGAWRGGSVALSAGGSIRMKTKVNSRPRGKTQGTFIGKLRGKSGEGRFIGKNLTLGRSCQGTFTMTRISD